MKTSIADTSAKMTSQMPVKNKKKKLSKKQFDDTLILILNRLVKGAINMNSENLTAEDVFAKYERMLFDSAEQIKKLIENV